MNTRTRLLLALFVSVSLIPTTGRSQAAPRDGITKTILATMQRNVDHITKPAAEKDRWDTNVAMWRITLADDGKIRGRELAQLRTLLEGLRGNVAAITEHGERQRWVANVTLWQAFIEGNRAPTRQHDTVFAALETMKKNVARLHASREKERWQANTNLWTSMLERTTAFASP